jgi:hypothetical protein
MNLAQTKGFDFNFLANAYNAPKFNIGKNNSRGLTWLERKLARVLRIIRSGTSISSTEQGWQKIPMFVAAWLSSHMAMPSGNESNEHLIKCLKIQAM